MQNRTFYCCSPWLILRLSSVSLSGTKSPVLSLSWLFIDPMDSSTALQHSQASGPRSNVSALDYSSCLSSGWSGERVRSYFLSLLLPWKLSSFSKKVNIAFSFAFKNKWKPYLNFRSYEGWICIHYTLCALLISNGKFLPSYRALLESSPSSKHFFNLFFTVFTANSDKPLAQGS